MRAGGKYNFYQRNHMAAFRLCENHHNPSIYLL